MQCIILYILKLWHLKISLVRHLEIICFPKDFCTFRDLFTFFEFLKLMVNVPDVVFMLFLCCGWIERNLVTDSALRKQQF